MSMLSDKSIITAPFQSQESLTNYVFKTKRIEILSGEKYNAGFLLGCKIPEVLHKRTEEAAKLYKNGVVERLYLSGGIGLGSKDKSETEAEKMKRILLNNDIPEKDIVIEDKSKTTDENMQKSLDLIRSDCGNNSSIVLITSDFHQKRAKGMLEKLLQDRNYLLNVYSYGTLDGKHDIDKWDLLMDSTKMIRQEAFLIAYALWKKKILDQEIEKIDVRTRK